MAAAPTPLDLAELARRLDAGEQDEIAYLIEDDYRVRLLDGSDVGDGKGSPCCFEALHGQTRPCDGCLVAAVRESGQPAWRLRKEGERTLRVSLYPLPGEQGQPERLLEIVRDVTREVELEAQLAQADRLSALGELVAGVAHEINNPNSVISGNLRIVAEALPQLLLLADARAKAEPDFRLARLPYEYFRERIEQLVTDMQESSERIETIVHDLRHFARRGEGRLDEALDLGEVATVSARLVERRLGRSAELELALGEGLPALVGNARKLQQVVVNLLLNAVHAIEDAAAEGEAPRRGKIGLRSGQRGELLWLEVSDDGVGISPATRRRLFDPFFTTRRTRGGTGLGLAIAFGIVAEHGGSIEVESTLGQGSVFRIVLPRQGAATTSASGDAASSVDARHGSSLDDEAQSSDA